MKALWHCLSIILILQSCARFRISELEPNLLFSLEISLPEHSKKNINNIQLQKSGHIYYGLPEKPLITNNSFVISDYTNHQIRFYESGEDSPNIVIGNNLKQKSFHEDTRLISIGVGLPGPIAITKDETRLCFVHHNNIKPNKPRFIVGGIAERPITSGSLIKHATSSIKCLSDNFKTISEIMQDGVDGKEYFKAVTAIHISEDQTWVLHNRKKFQKKWVKVLSLYQSGKKPIHFTTHAFKFLQKKPFKNRHIEIEAFTPSAIPGAVFIMVAVHDKTNFQLIDKKLIKLTAPDSTPEIIQSTDDPSDYFACIGNDGGYMMQNTSEDGTRILYKIFNQSNEYLNNERITFPEFRTAWQQVWCESDGRIYSSRLYQGQYEIHEWK